jgi:hypothetical protein
VATDEVLYGFPLKSWN